VSVERRGSSSSCCCCCCCCYCCCEAYQALVSIASLLSILLYVRLYLSAEGVRAGVGSGACARGMWDVVIRS
jgi:hypothetical protein